MLNLNDDSYNDDKEGVGEVEQQPQLHGFDVGSVGQRGGDRQVDRGQDHHDRDVDSDDQVILALTLQIHRGLVYQVHQKSGQKRYHYNTEYISFQHYVDRTRSDRVAIATSFNGYLIHFAA